MMITWKQAARWKKFCDGTLSHEAYHNSDYAWRKHATEHPIIGVTRRYAYETFGNPELSTDKYNTIRREELLEYLAGNKQISYKDTELASLRTRDHCNRQVDHVESVALVVNVAGYPTIYNDFGVFYAYVRRNPEHHVSIVGGLTFAASHLLFCNACMATAHYAGLTRLCSYYGRINSPDYAERLLAMRSDRLAIKQLSFLAAAGGHHDNVMTSTKGYRSTECKRYNQTDQSPALIYGSGAALTKRLAKYVEDAEPGSRSIVKDFFTAALILHKRHKKELAAIDAGWRRLKAAASYIGDE